jgi:hypothetical protein
MIHVFLVLLLVAFIAGAGVGFLAVLGLGIAREGRRYRYPLETETPSTVARGARAVNGLHVISRPNYEAVGYRLGQPPAGLDL